MPGEPQPVPLGTLGTVRAVHHRPKRLEVAMAWDDGDTLGLVIPPDEVELLEPDGQAELPF